MNNITLKKRIMRKIVGTLFTAILCLGFVPNTQSQEGYEGKKIYLDLAIGIPRNGITNNLIYNGFGYDRFSMPTLRANLEYGFNHFISGGLYAGYNHWVGEGRILIILIMVFGLLMIIRIKEVT